MAKLPDYLARWDDRLRFDYESTGDETCFRDMLDPKSRSRHVFAFHQPQTLHRWLMEEGTLRGRFRPLPALETTGLRDCQVDALQRLGVLAGPFLTPRRVQSPTTRPIRRP